MDFTASPPLCHAHTNGSRPGPHSRGAFLALVLAVVMALAGCGKSLSQHALQRGAGPVAAVGPQGAGGLSTKNTTRLGGSEATVDAAAVAIAVYPGLTASTRPRAVVLVDRHNWPGALAGSVLAGVSLGAPLLYTEGSALPEASEQALSTLRPTGASALGGAQVVRIGGGGVPPGYRARSVVGNSPAQLAVAIERLWSTLHGHSPRRLIVTAAEGPSAMVMPVAGLSARMDTPILFVGGSSIPSATRSELARIGQVSIYVVGPSAVVSERVVRELEHFGSVTRIAGGDPASNAIAVARFTDGSFGWGVEEPGHGLAFADVARPLDAPAAAPLSAGGDYAPLLLLENARELPPTLSSYLSDLQPGSPSSGPVHGVYNHGWLIGDESAISTVVQARLDTILEISSRPESEPTISQEALPQR